MKTKIIKSLLASFLGLSVVTFGALVASNNNQVEADAAFSFASDTELASYYNGVTDSMTGNTLRNKLNEINNSHRRTTLGYDALKTKGQYTEIDWVGSTPSGKMIGFYDNALVNNYWDNQETWNREHVWPDSLGGSKVEADILMVRPASVKINSSRGNLHYGEGSGGYDAGEYAEEYRGVAARIIFYSAIASTDLKLADDYNNVSGSNTMGKLSELLKWNLQYLPSKSETAALGLRVEQNRNEVNYSRTDLQNNRNPFVDHPEYACKIWGDTNATTKSICQSVMPTNYITVDQSSVSMKVGDTKTVTASASSGTPTFTWTSNNTSVATVSSGTITAVAAGSATITVSGTVNGESCSATVAVTVKNPTTGGEFEKFTGTIEAGEYVICDGTNALSNTVSSSRIQAETVTIDDECVVDPEDSAVWTIAASGSNWTLQNNGNDKYAAGTGAKNQSTLVDSATNDAKWNITGNSTYEIINVANSGNNINANLRYNSGVGFGTYATNIGNPLTLYKKSSSTPTPTKTLSSIAVSNAKTEYTVGDTFVKPTVTATYSDNTTADVTSSATFSGNDLSSAGTKTVNVSYTEGSVTKETQYTINVASGGSSGGTTYTIKWSDNGSDDSTTFTSENLLAYTAQGKDKVASYSDINKAFKGKTGVKLGGSSAAGSFKINLSSTGKVTATSIKAGIANYNDSDGGSIKIATEAGYATVKPASKTIEEATFSIAGSISTITVSTTSKRAYISYITVECGSTPTPTKTLSSIAVSNAKTEYTVGDEFVKPTVTATYSDNTTADVTTSATFSGNDLSSAGTKTVNVSYTEGSVTKETQYTITVSSGGSSGGETKSITITRNSFASASSVYDWQNWEQDSISGQAYIFGKETASMQFNGSKDGRTIFNSTAIPGSITKVTMNTASGTERSWKLLVGQTAFTTDSGATDGTQVGSDQTVTTAGVSWTVTGSNSYFMLYENSTSGSFIENIVIEYKTGSTPTPTKTLTGITVTNAKTSYYVGDAFVKPTVTATYDDSTTAGVTSSATCTGFDSTTTGTKTITVSYTEGSVTETATYTITVSVKAADHGTTASDPLTVSEAREIIDAGTEGSTVWYIKGLVKKIATAWDSGHGNISFYMLDMDATDKESDTDFEGFRIASGNADASLIGVGDTVIISGQIQKYKSTYEANTGSLVSREALVDKAAAYATTFNNANVCGTDNNTPAIKSVWSSMATEFASLDIFTKDYLKSATTSDTNTAISQCIARYDRVLEVRGTTDFANFMGRGVSSSSNRTAVINDSATIVMCVLFVTTFVGFAAIAVLKKKKFSK